MGIQGHVDEISAKTVTGWAIDWDQPSVPLEILLVVNGAEVGRCRTDIERPGLKQALGGQSTGIHEFRFYFDPPLKPSSHYVIEVMAAPQGTLLPNGRATLFPENNENGAFTPILVTSSGRSGSTMVMQEFATHPDIVISNIYPFEIKMTSYYAALWNVLTAGCHTPTEIETDFGAHSTDDFLVGRNPWNRPDLLEAVGGVGAIRLMQKTFPGKLEYLFRSTIEDYYGILADKNKASAGMFAEKSAINEPVRSACRVLFGAVKEIVLVRDPRDYVCSARSFWRTEPDRMFTTMEAELPMLMKIHRKAHADTLFVRYEDLILEAETDAPAHLRLPAMRRELSAACHFRRPGPGQPSNQPVQCCFSWPFQGGSGSGHCKGL